MFGIEKPETTYQLIRKKIGLCYYFGKGVEQSYAMTWNWYTKNLRRRRRRIEPAQLRPLLFERRRWRQRSECSRGHPSPSISGRPGLRYGSREACGLLRFWSGRRGVATNGDDLEPESGEARLRHRPVQPPLPQVEQSGPNTTGGDVLVPPRR